MRGSRAFPDWRDTPPRPRRAGLLRRVLPARGLQAARTRTLLRVLLFMAPTLLAIAYYGAIATDRYVSEARFVIRTASKPANMLGGLNALLQLVGMSRSQDDAYAVRDFLASRDALHQLGERVDLRRIYGEPAADPLSRYPGLLYGRSDEELFRYFERMLTVVVNNTSGLTTLRVQAFHAEDARQVARILLDLGEDLVNRLNERMQADAVRLAEGVVARSEERLVASQVAITAFRNRELLLDPGKSSAVVVELIGRLSTLLAEVRMQIAETQGSSPNSPQLQSLNQRAAAIERQIGIERGRVSNASDGLAEKIAEYERMMLEREFATRALTAAVAALESARIDARRQQLFLERVVEPGLPDEATMPRRWRTILTVLGFNLIGVGMLWMFATGLREHAARGEH